MSLHTGGGTVYLPSSACTAEQRQQNYQTKSQEKCSTGGKMHFHTPDFSQQTLNRTSSSPTTNLMLLAS